MPSPFTPSFASAAAGSTNSDGSSNGRNNGSGDWSRSRINGTTTTFRRPSGANNLLQRGDTSSNPPTPAASAYIPPPLSSGSSAAFARNGNVGETRYSKDQLLDMYRNQGDNPSPPRIDSLLLDGWHLNIVNGTDHGGWSRNDNHRDINGPDLCWDINGSVEPLGLIPLSEEEKEAFSNTVNSPLKPPTQNKDGTPNTPGLNRRTSVSQSQNSANNSSSRPSGRQRRDSSDLLQSSNSVTSPTNNRFSKDEPGVTSPPPSLLRRKTDYKDDFGPSIDDKEKDGARPRFDPSSPFGSLKRTSTNPIGSLNGPSSPWTAGPSSAGFAPMGTFGNFGLAQTPTDKKPGFGSMRSESRFKSLMGGDTSEHSKKPKEQTSSQRLAESSNEQPRSPWDGGQSGHRKGMRELYEDDDEPPAGSAALGGDDVSPAAAHSSKFRNMDGQTPYDDIGFSSLGIGSDLPFRDLSQRNRDYASQQTPHRTHAQPQAGELSPTYTNPYHSPEGDKGVPEDTDTDDSDPHHLQYQQHAPFGRGFANQNDVTSDRGQTSSSITPRTFSNMSALAGLGGLGNGPWSAAPGAVGTPSRAFGDPTFGAFGDVSSPGHGGFSGVGFFGGAGGSSLVVSTAGPRSSKLGALFPSAMQDQSRSDPHRQDRGSGDTEGFPRALGTNAPGFAGAPARETDSPSQLGRSRLDDLLNSNEDRVQGLANSGPSYASNESSLTPNSYYDPAQDQEQSSNQLPASQQRTMVMPDRMRWIYRDPSGNQQGPWSGLEMHDWYKAGFFSPELQVKKQEDNDYEPLAQLIRRIGNSREPFLVPQIGIAHGPPSAAPSVTAAAPAASTPSATAGSAQPPFASSFPSFGTTLTAEQQNALERRKQEEQYLMARQKEHLASMQPNIQRQMQHNLHNQQLHHHSSAHSLHSQPSYGSITSPVGYQPSPAVIQPQAAGPGFFDGMSRNAGHMAPESLGHLREEELPGYMERMNLARGGQLPFGSTTQSQDQYHQQQVNVMLQDKARLQREQELFDATQRETSDSRASADRYEEFQRFRAQEEERIQQQQSAPGQMPHPQEQHSFVSEPQVRNERSQEQLSLSEQVQKAAAKQDPGMQPQSPWAKVETGMPQPFPPPQSSSPMPAPTPQRNRQSVADALNAESQSQTPSQTDSAETPSAAVAPWAKELSENSKGPSLKEIQAMEARKAAQQEEIAAAARRAAAEQERLAQQNQPTAPAPGLPSSANWASSVSPAVPMTTGPSPWARPTSGRPSVATPVTGAKKTLAQIQKEEEARKNRAAAAAAAGAASTSNAIAAGGKRYADLASKAASQATPNSNNTAWTTVGAGGKTKAPVAPASATTPRALSGTIVPSATTAAKPKPSVSTTGKSNSSQQAANEEFKKWTRNALSKGLDINIHAEDFISALLNLPPEPEIIADSIYSSSTLLDGRRFAEEFIRRRKLADRGIVPDPSTHSGVFFNPGNANEGKGGGNGGWNEVAKKGGGTAGNAAGGATVATEGSQFRVVSKKKVKR